MQLLHILKVLRPWIRYFYIWFLNFVFGIIPAVVKDDGSVDGFSDNWTFMKRRPKLEVEATFIVGDFDKEMEICKPGEKMESRVFILGETPFKICVYPSGEREVFSNYVPICLVNESNTDVNVDAKFEICNIGKFTWENETLPSASTSRLGFLMKKDEISV